MTRQHYTHAVTGDFSRLVYSRHRTAEAAERAAQSLARQWGWSHPGSEPRVVAIGAHEQSAEHIAGGEVVRAILDDADSGALPSITRTGDCSGCGLHIQSIDGEDCDYCECPRHPTEARV